MPKRSKGGRRKLCEFFITGGAGSETLEDGKAVPMKPKLRSGWVSEKGVGMVGGAVAGEGKGGSKDGSRRAGLSFGRAELKPLRGTDLGTEAPTSPSGEVGRLEDDKATSRRCWVTLIKSKMLSSIMATVRWARVQVTRQKPGAESGIRGGQEIDYGGAQRTGVGG